MVASYFTWQSSIFNPLIRSSAHPLSPQLRVICVGALGQGQAIGEDHENIFFLNVAHFSAVRPRT